jgi:hypothetical protein
MAAIDKARKIINSKLAMPEERVPREYSKLQNDFGKLQSFVPKIGLSFD